MTWQILNTEPAYGICDQCKQHECGVVDGEHKWIMTGTYDRVGDPIVFGYKCVELWAANLGISKEIVEKEVRTPPTQEEIGEFLRGIFSDGTPHTWDKTKWGKAEWGAYPPGVPDPFNKVESIEKSIPMPVTRDELKAWLDERGITYFKGLSDDKLRDLVMQHA